MFLSFFLFQAILRMVSGPERLIARAFEQINLQIDPLQRMSIGPVFKQLDKLLAAEATLPKDLSKDTSDESTPPID